LTIHQSPGFPAAEICRKPEYGGRGAIASLFLQRTNQPDDPKI
jgi:hypothetical protein